MLAEKGIRAISVWHVCCIYSVVTGQDNHRGATLISSTIQITASENSDSEILRVLRSLIEPTRVETGCISCGLYKDLHDPSVIVWVEEWETQDDLERHLRSRQYKKILAAFDMSNSQPVMRFNTVVETKGMQLIADARGMEI
jgi:quinol monooxygenase YgiN